MLFDLEPEFLTLFERCSPMSMTSIERMYALYTSVRYLVENGIGGDFVECGVWRGGSAMMMALVADACGDRSRQIWLYDTFAGMTPPSDDDRQAMTGQLAAEVLATNAKDTENPFWGIAERSVVEANLASTGYPVDLLRLIEGDIADTLEASAPQSVALLRLDTDWYASTKHELEILYPRLCSGGVLIVDDYGYWTGARRAVDEYFGSLDHRPLLTRIDFTGRLAIKP